MIGKTSRTGDFVKADVTKGKKQGTLNHAICSNEQTAINITPNAIPPQLEQSCGILA